MTDDDLSPEIKAKIEESEKELVGILANINDKEFLSDFLGCLLTEAERFDLGKRWLLVKELNMGTTQREIAHDFKMSLCKITRGSKELKKEGSAFRRLLNEMDDYNEKQRLSKL